MPPKSKENLGLSQMSWPRYVLAYAPPGWALFELDLVDGAWKVKEFNSGQFNFGDDLAAQMRAMDEFVVLCLRFPNARVYYEDELGNEREGSWLEYALHRLGDSFLPMVGDPAHTDEKLKKWGYWDRDERARDAIRLGIAGIAAWKEEETGGG